MNYPKICYYNDKHCAMLPTNPPPPHTHTPTLTHHHQHHQKGTVHCEFIIISTELAQQEKLRPCHQYHML